MRKYTSALLILFLSFFQLEAQSTSREVRNAFRAAADSVTAYFHGKSECVTTLNVDRVVIEKNGRMNVYFSKYLGEFAFHEGDVDSVYYIVKQNFPTKYTSYKDNFRLYCVKTPIEDYTTYGSNYNGTNGKSSRFSSGNRFAREENPLTLNSSKPYTPTSGLNGRHIALWQSHGRYYNQKEKRWEWQRPRLFETVEDLFTQSYVLPFLVPMLENAGAVVVLPRERDLQTHESVVDNDSALGYSEGGVKSAWATADSAGFSNSKVIYLQGDNPFRSGTARYAKTTEDSDNLSTASWKPQLEQDGEYAVYVSYQSFPNSCTIAHYEVRHNGGTTTFEVNHKMGGGTWIYLGTFGFSSGADNQGVTLTNQGARGGIVSADAVRFGGGMGNIARSPAKEDEDGKPIDIGFDVEPETSSYPRFCEAARYNLQWAGMVDTIY